MITADLEAVVERVRASTVAVHGLEPGGGSGIIWRADGLVVTNAHVARRERLTVELSDGRALDARVTARDARRDLATLQVAAHGLEAAEIGDSAALRVGELVMAVGNPLGVAGAVATGVVQSRTSDEWVRADVRLAPGNSGGPLVDAHGRVVGINSLIANGLAHAVPSREVGRFLAGIERPRLGVTLQPVGVEAAVGWLVLEVGRATLAEELGLITGDVLLGINGQRLARLEDLGAALEGGPFALDVLRGGRRLSLAVDPRRAGKSRAA